MTRSVEYHHDIKNLQSSPPIFTPLIIELPDKIIFCGLTGIWSILRWVHGTFEISSEERWGVVEKIPGGIGDNFLLLERDTWVRFWQSRKLSGSREWRRGMLLRYSFWNYMFEMLENFIFELFQSCSKETIIKLQHIAELV